MIKLVNEPIYSTIVELNSLRKINFLTFIVNAYLWTSVKSFPHQPSTTGHISLF